jgi:multidrug efflux pump subunit AcrA (membrane-fusion protein)
MRNGCLLIAERKSKMKANFSIQQCQMSAADTKQLAVSTVAVVSPAVHLPGSGLDLPAEVKPWQEASIYSRVNGYLKSWLVDIGAHVEQGQLLPKSMSPISSSKWIRHNPS